jgi:nuclear transport factor 2 (NTF2) superfamily protein
VQYSEQARPPFPPFTKDLAVLKVRMAEDAWNTQDPQLVSRAYTADCVWRNRSETFTGRAEIIGFLTRKWAQELDYRLIKELWLAEGNKIAVRFQYEYRNDKGNHFRAYGNEYWEFAENGLMKVREASINDVEIKPEERLFLWPKGPRPESFPGLSELSL